jgi:HD-GYP domain-containing protein (c-di-GMP phosphodiesterase class II)
MPLSLWSLIAPLARTFDLMDPVLAEHGMRVAYLATRLGEELGLPAWKRRELAMAGALHDIGAFSLAERLDLLDFEASDEGAHCRAGALLLRHFPPFARIAESVEFHHRPWENGEGASEGGRPIPMESHILHLADRTAVLLSRDKPILGQMADVREKVAARSGSQFFPPYVDALLRLVPQDYVWLEIASGETEHAIRASLGTETIDADLSEMLSFARLVCRIIDFKSEFTATHSSGVAAVARALASRAGFSRRECTLFEIAAYLHDLGKLAVPSEILEKKGRLSPEEWSVMRTHVFYTYQVLNPIEILGLAASWGALHQERLNGTGYPFGYREEELPLGARIMAVADVSTGLTEDRPYRKGMTRSEALETIRGMASKGELDGRVVALLERDFDEINRFRADAQGDAAREYETFREALRRPPAES